jgi:anti-sigma regulatory factor (Ser/Thr protein kinase)
MAFGSEASTAAVRAFVADAARRAGLGHRTTQDLVLAVHELATNSIRHGGGGGRARVWADDAALVCEVRDDGHIEDPLVGRRRPPDDASGARGLWMANRLVDLLQLRSSAAGTTVRVHVRRSR